MSIETESWNLETLAIRHGYQRTEQGEHGEALFLTSSFVYDSAEQAANRFSGKEAGNIYSRFTNPNISAFEARIAALEGGERAVATASGMAAILTLCMGLLSAGDHVVCSRNVFGASHQLFDKHLRRFGIETTFVQLTDLSAWQAAIQPNTKLFFLESPSNPLLEVADIRALSALAHTVGAWCAVDNCLLTPILQQPLALGADLVVHSATKFIDGQGRALGGVIVGSHALLEPIYAFLRTTGASMSPFNAWVFLKGLETLSLRMHAHSTQAATLARWLRAHPNVVDVFYPDAEHTQAELIAQQQRAGGALLSFRVQGGRAQAWHVIDQVRICSRSANLGDVKSIITHPATTTHGRVAEAERLATGVSENLIRLSVGLENIEDLCQDLARGLDSLSAVSSF